MVDSLSTRARALLEADGKARKEPPSAVNDRRWLGINAMAIADAPDIARAYLSAMETIRRLGSSEAFDLSRALGKERDAELLARMDFARAWLERHESEA